MRNVLSVIAKCILYVISLLPWWILFRISDLLYLVLRYVVGYRRKVIDTNLSLAFPEKTEMERLSIQKKYYRYLADILVETVKLFTLSSRQVFKRVEVLNAEVIRGYFREGRSVIGVLGHYGNWEMSALRFSQLFAEPRYIVYKPLSNKVADGMVKKMRSRFGAILISMKETARTLISFRGIPSMTVMVSDQTPPKSEIQYFAKFLNQPTAVFLGVEKLAKITNSIVVFCDIRRLGRGRYRCEFVTLYERPNETLSHEITNGHVAYLEKVIREKPEYWLWSHRRWKFKPDEINRSFD
ncbi:lysophospholipid acyltransferase family protein [Pedobacter helvus]|uniref:Lysophospholipid acyltransferase family protein n=1 Tax=Pedobacter helvus TaxID=2563444 RepID=A0ABW9JMJ5_9SPHI|nr:lysophospholipid acyltransferase family protein [Pedobacter ureilyticus]